MKGKLRYIGILVGVLLVTLIALPFFINANSFRPAIEQRLSSALGRGVQIGNLSLSIFSGSLSAEHLSIFDDPSFNQSPFLTGKSLKIGVELWPLITSRTLNVTHLIIEEPQIVLIRNKEGKWNYSTLATGSAGQQGEPSSGREAGSSSSQPAESSPGSPAASKSRASAAPDFTVAELRLEKGRVTVGSTASDKKSAYDNVNLEATNLSLKSQFPVTLTANLPGGGDFKANGKVGPVNQSDASLSPLDVKVSITDLDLAKTGFMDPSTGIAGTVNVSNTLHSTDGLARAEGSMNMNKLQLVKGGAPSGVPVGVDFKIDYDLRKNAGVLNQATAKIGNAISRLSGTFDRRVESTVLDMKLDGQNVPVQDLQAALPALGIILPKGSSLQTGTLSTNLNIQGPLERLVATGNVGLFNAKVAGFDMGSKMAALSAFSGIKGSGRDTSIEKLTSQLRVAPEGIQTTNLDLVVSGIGQLNGGGTISSASALNLRMVATLSAESGIASAVGSLTGRPMSKNARIPFMIQGTTSDPKFVPDVGGMVGSALESELGKALGDNPKTKGLSEALDGLFGGKKKKSK
jgi:AsmA protein